MPIRPVLELSVAHAFLAAGALPGSALEPEPATADRLRGLRMVVKPTGTKLTIFADFAGGAPRIALGEPARLGFRLGRPAPDLATASEPLPADTLFTDAGAPAGDPQPLRRATHDGAADPRRLARVEITLTPAELAHAATKAPRRCIVELTPRAARWCYHLVTDRANPLAEWRIARGGGANGGPAPSFGDAGRFELTGPAADDPVGEGLRRAHPSQRVIRFLSDAPAEARERPVRRLELHAGSTRLFGSLPNPSPAGAALVGGQPVFSQVIQLTTA